MNVDGDQFHNLIIEMNADVKVTKALLENFVKVEFAKHVEEDNRISKLVNSTAQRISRIYWSVGGALTLLTVLEAYKAISH